MNHNLGHASFQNVLVSFQYWCARLIPDIQLSPRRIAIGYTLLGFIALYISDVIFLQLFVEPFLSQVQTLKGGVEVVLTAGFIYIATSRRENQLGRSRARLERQSQELEVLHRVLRHNLRNDINIIQGYAEWLENEIDDNELFDKCGKLIDMAGRISHYTDQARRVRNISAKNGELVTHDLNSVITDITQNTSIPHESRISTSVPSGIKVEGNPMLPGALEELITNAFSHNDSENPEVNIEVISDIQPSHMVEIRIIDNGPGIPESQLEPLREGQEDQLVHLSGMGLWFVKWTIRHSDGTLEFRDSDSGGTVVAIQVPKAPEMLSSRLGMLNGD